MASSSSSRPSMTRKSSSRRTMSLQKIDIRINVYDLLPPGRLSGLLWTIGSSLLHSGIVISGKEYAYGGHDKPGVSGVYWTRPKTEPPGGTWRIELLQGFTFRQPKEIDEIIKEASQKFQGTSYNLLTNNCNHFTNYLCQQLTSKPAPGWLNRAASIGIALPCVVPREWLAPPDHDTADGELLDEDDEDNYDERASFLRSEQRRRTRVLSDEDLPRVDEDESDKWGEDMDRIASNSRTSGESYRDESRRSSAQGAGLRLAAVKDTSGRNLPVPERAPMPKR